MSKEQANLNQKLLLAIVNNDLEGVIQYLDDGADVDTWQPDGNAAAIHLATNLNNVWEGPETSNGYQITQELLSHDADVNVSTEEGFTPLLLAAYSGDVNLVMAILAYGEDETDEQAHRFVDLNAITRQMRYSALHLAALQGHEEIIILLLEEGVDHTMRNLDGKTAADIAAENGYLDLEEILRQDQSILDEDLLLAEEEI